MTVPEPEGFSSCLRVSQLADEMLCGQLAARVNTRFGKRALQGQQFCFEGVAVTSTAVAGGR